MRLKILTVAALVSLGFASEAAAQGFGAKLKSFGKWTVYRSEDAITDERSCIAIFGEEGRIQVTEDSFAVSLRGKGGLGGYIIRLDSLPAWEMRLPSDVEKDVGAFIVEGKDFEQIMAAKRLRVRVLTVLSELVDFDIDISRGSEFLSVLKSADCHGKP